MTARCFTRQARRWAALGAVLVTVFGAAAASHAHFVVSRRSLRALITESDLVVHARVVEEERVEPIEGGERWRRRPPSVRVLGVIKGPATKGERITFAQHGHGSAELERGQDVVLCLRDVTRSRELAPIAESMGVRWYSDQEHDDDWALSQGSGKAVLAAARRYAQIEEMRPPERDQALRKITVRLLTSEHPRLAKSALQDLVDLPDDPLVAPADVPRLKAVIDDGKAPIEIRLGLLVELERRGLLEGDASWLRLLRTAGGPDRLAVIPAAGRRRDPATQAELVRILEGPDMGAATAAAVALGSRGNTAAIEPLRKALASGESRLAIAAIRGLGQIGTPEARAVIAQAASDHPDREVRRRAQAETRLLENRSMRP